MLYRFSEFELDTGRHELRANGELCVLEPQVFDLLCHLVENHDRLVSRDELITAIWNGRIVSESTIDARIHAARKAVNDDGRRQSRIKTLPRRGYRFIADVEVVANVSQMSIESGELKDLSRHHDDKPTIAVLPFENMSNDMEQEYFADGITEEIITALSQVSWFFVIARNSSFSYKDQTIDVKQIGADLGVRYVIEGSVRKADNRVRVVAQLIDCESGNHIWAERFDQELGNIFAVQDEITSNIAGALLPEIIESEEIRALRIPPKDLTAQDLFWRGMWHYYKYDRQAFGRARDLFENALLRDPKHAEALVMLGFLKTMSAFFGWCDSPDDAFQESIRYASRALTLERNNARAHLLFSAAYQGLRHWDQAKKYCVVAVALNPNYAPGHFILGCCELFAGDARAAVQKFRRAIRLSPKDRLRFFYEISLALSYFRLRRYNDAVEWANSAIRLKSDFINSHFDLAAALGHLGRREEAEAVLLQACQMQPEFDLRFFQTGWPFEDPADFEHFMDGLYKAGLPAA